MSRRSLLSLLAGLPFVGAIVSGPATEGTPIAGIPRLASVRDLLLPALRSLTNKHWPLMEFYIDIDHKADALIVKGYNVANDATFGFAITRKQITENRYKVEFCPLVTDLIALLQNSRLVPPYDDEQQRPFETQRVI